MNRLKRMKRVAAVAEKSEQIARREVALASRDVEQARASLESVRAQCEQLATSAEELPLRFGRALLETGWLLADERASLVDQALVHLEERRGSWTEQRTRLDALGRLIERLEETDRAEQDARQQQEFADLVTTRFAGGHDRREPVLSGAAS